MLSLHVAFYALLTDQENNLWALSNPDYQLYPLPIGKYDPRQDDIQIIGDLFNWTVSIDKKDGEHIFALDATDYSFDRFPDLSATKVAWPQKSDITFSRQSCLLPRMTTNMSIPG